MSTLSTTALSIGSLLASYEEADDGYPENMCDLFSQRIMVDAHLRAVLGNRRESVARKPWVLQEGGDSPADKQAAVNLESALRDVPGFTAVLEHQLTANPFGWALSEIDWQRVGGLAVPVGIENAPQRRFRFDRKTDTPLLLTKPTDIDGVPLIPGKWWYTHRTDTPLIASSGLMRTAAIWSHFKSLSVRDWLVFADRFGLPYVLGKYEEQVSPEDKATLEAAVAAVGTDGYATVSEACEIALTEAKTGGRAEDVHGSLVTLCDLQISKLIAGATLVQETTGQASYAIGRVHQNTNFALLLGDAGWLAESFADCIGRPFVKFNNLKARPPRLKMYLALDVSIKEQVQIASICANELGMEIDEEQIRDLTLLRRPQGTPLVGTKKHGPMGDDDEQA
jgi:phage gp29-like protein